MLNRIANRPATFVIPTADADGTRIVATAARWAVLDERGVELASGVVTDFDPEEDDFEFSLTAEELALPADVSHAGREVVATFTTAVGEVEVSDYFVLVSAAPLKVAENSFLTLAEALGEREEFATLQGWDAADKTRRTSAMIEAYRHLCQMVYLVSGFAGNQSNIAYAQNGLGSDHEEIFGAPHCRVSLLTLAEFDALPAAFRRALKRAQLAEADALLGGNPVGDKRKAGMISETVGESSGFFRSNPLKMPICEAAFDILRRYIYLGVKIQRT